MPALDGLRGLAILLVLCCHVSDLSGGATSSAAPQTIRSLVLDAGWTGVDLFFVLSGFLITGILLATRTSDAYYRSFYSRRVLRIFPLYYLSLFVLLLLKGRLYNTLDRVSLLSFTYNFRAVAIRGHLQLVSSLWSLAVEEQFYFVWPWIVKNLRVRQLRMVCVAGILVSLAWRLWVLPRSTGFQSAYYLTPCRMDELLGGALLAIWRTDENIWRRVRRYAGAAGFGALAGLVAITLWTGHFYDWVLYSDVGRLRHSSVLVLGPGVTLLAVLFGAMVAACTWQGTLYRVFLARPLRIMGKYSYGMYLLHLPVLIFLLNLPGRALHVQGPVPGWYFVPAAFVCTFLAAWLSFHLVEQHFLKLKRLVPAR